MHDAAWRRFVTLFVTTFLGGVVGLGAFVVLMDPYDVVPFSLPIERRLVSISQRHMYPQVARSGRFDSVIVGTSTSRLLDPEVFNAALGVRLANLAMDSATAWEQLQILSVFGASVAKPKMVIVGLDRVWCEPGADRERITFRGFPEWMYDANRWNDLLYLFNLSTVEIAGRLLGYHLGLYPERVRYDGFEVFVPHEEQYDLERARHNIWQGPSRSVSAQEPPVRLSEQEERALRFPAVTWLQDAVSAMPDTHWIFAWMPVHVAAQPQPGSHAAAVENACKARVASIAERHSATLLDWRVPSSLTSEDANYWDPLHYRLPIAYRLADEIVAAARGRAERRAAGGSR